MACSWGKLDNYVQNYKPFLMTLMAIKKCLNFYMTLLRGIDYILQNKHKCMEIKNLNQMSECPIEQTIKVSHH